MYMLYTIFWFHMIRRGWNAIQLQNALAIFTVAFLNSIDRVTGVKKGWNTCTIDTVGTNARAISWKTVEAGQFYMVQVGYEVVTTGEVTSRTQFCRFWAEI